MDTKFEQIVSNSGVEVKLALNNLPAELTSLARFFACNADKKPRVKEWQKPENQKPMGEVNSEFKGFCIGEEGAQPAVLFLDFDHVLTDDGSFVNDEAQYWFEYIRGQFGADSFCERSIGGHGLHIPALPTEGKFPKISAGPKGTLYFGEGAKLEIFYKTARFCLVTGALFNCSAPAQIPKGIAVDEVLKELLKKIRGNKKLDEYDAEADTDPQPTKAKSQAEQEYDLFRAPRMLAAIPCAEVIYNVWLAVVSACKNIGLPYADVDAWNKSDPKRYNPDKNLDAFNSLHDPSFDIATLHGIAKNFGYTERDSRAEYQKLGKTPPPTRHVEPIPPDLVLNSAQKRFLGSVNCSDLSLARRVEYLHSEKIRYVEVADRWLIWSSKGVWREAGDANAAVMPLVQKTSDALRLNGQGEGKLNATMRRAGFYLQDTKHANPCIAMMKGLTSLRITKDDLNTHPFLFNVANGVVDLTTGRLFEADPKLLITHQCPVQYRKNCRSPVVSDFLNSVLPDADTLEATLIFLGYCLTADVRHHKAMFWKGKGGNGKGTFTRLLKRVFGTDYSCDVGCEAFLIGKLKDSSAPQPDLNNLRGRRLAFVEELQPQRKFDVATLKKMTGGDRVTARALYQNFDEGGGFDPTHKLIFSGNHMPSVADVNDKGLIRRLLCVPFDVDFTENPDEELDNKLKTPDALAGMLALLIAHAVDWYKSGKLKETPLMTRAKQKYIADNDFVNEFADEFCILKAGAVTKRKEFEDKLRAEYPQQCAPFRKNELTELIKDRLAPLGVVYKDTGRGKYIYENIGLTDPNIAEPPPDR